MQESNLRPSAPEGRCLPSAGATLTPVGGQLGASLPHAAAKMLAIALLTEVADVGVVGVPLATAFDVAARRVEPSYPAEPSMMDRLLAAARWAR